MSDEKRTKDATKEKQHLLQSILFLVLFALLIFGLIAGPLAYRRWKAEKTREANQYHGFQFDQLPAGLWQTEIIAKGQPYTIKFHYHPRDTENVSLEEGIVRTFFYKKRQPKEIYITLPPDGGSQPVVAAVDISKLTGERYNLLNIPTRSALQAPSDLIDTPVITCADATNETSVFFFQQGPLDGIVRDQKNPFCIRFIYKNESESIRVADRFAYALLQIMPG